MSSSAALSPSASPCKQIHPFSRSHLTLTTYSLIRTWARSLPRDRRSMWAHKNGLPPLKALALIQRSEGKHRFWCFHLIMHIQHCEFKSWLTICRYSPFIDTHVIQKNQMRCSEGGFANLLTQSTAARGFVRDTVYSFHSEVNFIQ